jgi:hypothetical protein
MPLSTSVEGEYSLGDNGDAASLWEVRMVLGVVASRFFMRFSVPARMFFAYFFCGIMEKVIFRR